MEDFAGTYHNMQQAAIFYCEGRNDGDGTHIINSLAFGREYVQSFLNWESGTRQKAHIGMEGFYDEYVETFLSFKTITQRQ